jgi:hypothetical protein
MVMRSIRPTVLHVVERSTGAACEFDRAIDQAGFDVQHVETVYGAMARIARPETGLIDAVVVCVDGLEPSELQFFTFAGQRCPDLPLYIYGQSTDGSRTQRALALGARLQVAAQQLADILIAPPTDVAEAPEPEPASAPLSADVMVETSADTQVTDTKVPTPWEPASSQPKRTPPGSRRQETSEADRPSQAPSDAASDPLLTRQEIDALFSEPQAPQQAREAADNEPG